MEPAGGFQLSDDVLSTVRLLLKNRYVIIVLTVAAMVAGGVRSYFAPPQYQANVLLLPSANDRAPAGLGQIVGLASSLGMNIGLPSVSVAYPDILKSRQVQERVLDRKFSTETAGTITLQEYLFPSEMPPLQKRAMAIASLGARVRVGVEKASGMISLAVTMPEPKLAVVVAEAFVEELISVEQRIRVDAARHNRMFISERLEDAISSLETATSAVKEFREHNVRIGNDPQLLLEAAELEREMRIQEELYVTLTQQHELAKLEESRRNAGIQVVDPAQEPFDRAGPILLRDLILSGFFGFVAALLVVIAHSGWVSGRLQLRTFGISE